MDFGGNLSVNFGLVLWDLVDFVINSDVEMVFIYCEIFGGIF